MNFFKRVVNSEGSSDGGKQEILEQLKMEKWKEKRGNGY